MNHRLLAIVLVAALLMVLMVWSCDTSAAKLGSIQAQQVSSGTSGPQSVQRNLPNDEEADRDVDADLGKWGSRPGIDHDEYLRLRDEYIARKRGIEPGRPFNPELRSRALQQMDLQESNRKLESLVSGGLTPAINPAAAWTAIGPNTISNGQALSGGNTSVSGRVTAVVVDPTNANNVYLGTAQGGVWRSLDGGATWAAIFDSAQSLAVGALTLATSDPSILYVGTGEFNGCGDCFFGVGLYRIDNVNTTPTLVGPINPSQTVGNLTYNIFNGRSITKIAVDPTNPATIFVSTARGIGGSGVNSFGAIPALATRGLWRSTNATGAAGSVTFQKLVINSDNSADTPGTGNTDTTDIVIEPGNADHLLVTVIGSSSTGGIFRTINARAGTPTFTQVYAAAIGVRLNLAINKVASVVTAYAATSETPNNTPGCTSAGTGAVRKQVDPFNSSANWGTQLTGGGGFCGGQCFYNIAIAVNPNDANEVYLGGNARGTCSDGMKKSTNGGAGFSRDDNGLHADSHTLYYDGSGTTIFTGNDGGVWKRAANAAPATAWTNLNAAPLNTLQFQSIAVHPSDRDLMIGGTQDNGTQYQQTSAGNWSNAEGGDGGYCLIDQSATNTTNVNMYHTFFNLSGVQIGFDRAVNTTCLPNKNFWPTRGAFGGANDLGLSCDGTANYIQNGININDAVLFYAPMALGPGTPNALYFGSDRLYRSTNRGDSMTVVSQASISNPGGTGSPISTIAIGPGNDNIRMVGLEDGQVWATSTGSSTMVNITSGSFPANPNGSIANKFVGRAVIDSANPNVAYVAFSFYAPAGQGIWKITNLGAASGVAPVAAVWTAAANGIPSVPINGLAIDPQNSNYIYAGTDVGVYFTTDGGASWNPLGTGLPRSAVFDLQIQPSNRILRAATHGRGVWEIAIGAVPPTLGNYANSSVALSGDSAISPSVAPISAVGLNASTTSDFKGTFAADPATGLVRVTDAHPAGSYLVTVTASNTAGSTSKTFTLTVQPGTACAGYIAFTNAATVAAGNQPQSLAIGDFNNDGKQDLATANFVSNNVSIRLGNGSGSFDLPATPEIDVASEPYSIALGDFNNDGKLDLATANAGSNNVSIRLGNGAGGFTSPGTPEVAVGSAPYSIALGDFNNDGTLDFVTANIGSNNVSIRLGDGSGGFIAPATPEVSVGTQPLSVAAADLNGDGKLDFVVANAVSDNVSIRLGNGTGGFSSPATSEVPVGAPGANPISIAIGDFNGDGKPDFATANIIQDNVSIRLGDGTGAFNSPTIAEVVVGDAPRSVVIGDFNNDGKQDFAAVNESSNNVSIRIGNGAGGFSSPAIPEVAAGSSPYFAAIGDFNADGKQDLAIGNFNTASVSIRLGLCGIAPSINSADNTTFSTGSFASFNVNRTGNPQPSLNISGTLPAGVNFSAATGQLSGTPGPNSGGIYNLTFTAANGFAPDASQNFALTVLSPALVSGQKTVSGNFAVGQAVTYSVVLANTGPGAQRDNSGNEFIDVLPSGLTLVAASASSGTATATVATRTVTWNGTIPSGNSVTITIQATINAGQEGQSIANQGTISYDADGNGTNEAGALTDDPAVAGTSNATSFHVNAPPAITAAPGPVTRTAGSGSSNSTVANVDDAESAKSTLAVLVNNGPSATVNGVTVSNLSVSASGVVTADVVAACGATTANFTLKVTDSGGLSSSLPLSVTVNSNSNPVLTYPGAPNVAFNGSMTINPATGPTDNGSVNSIILQSQGSYTGTISVNNSTGVVAISNAAPAGTHTITIRATDNCNATTDASFSLVIPPAATTTALNSSANPSAFGSFVTFTATVSSSAGTPTGSVQFKSDGTKLGAAVTLVSGMAQLVTSALAAGSHTITAEYSGDQNFLTSTGTLSGAQLVRPALSINDVSINEGNSGTVSASFTVTLSAPSNQTVTVNFVTADGTGQSSPSPPPPPGIPPPGSDFFANIGALTFAPGETTKTINVAIIGDFAFEPDETFFVNLSNATNASISDAQGVGTIVNDDAPGGSLGFFGPDFTVLEIAGSVLISVQRKGDTTQAVTVDYATSDITADGRKDYTAARGTLRFGPGDGGKDFLVLVNEDAFNEGNEFVQLTLSNPTGGAALGPQSTATLQITNLQWNSPPANSIDDASRFVRQHYHDFLNRDTFSDPGGLAFWTNQITECQQPGATCDPEVRRINVSAAFFLSIEFQETGYLVERVYKTAFGDAVGLSNFGPGHTLAVPVIRFDEFLPDTQSIGQGVIVGQGNWQTVLESNKQAFIAEFVQRPRFLSAFPLNLTAAQFVNQLNANAGNPVSPAELNQLVTSGMSRAQMLRAVAEHQNLISSESNRAFVLIQYFGYLRRNPNEAPDSDYTGYDFWLSKLNQFNGNFINAEMVKAFINSSEYRGRFGP